ncbi:MAG: hypothetical protein JWO82_2752 [Akkermansiaceae bacterium]|nr:hypothetical protein [Akkermansiaceae bacterium]
MKSALLEKIRHELRAQLERLSKAALDAHAAATDPGSKAESKYDTRSLEASYLAVGQAKQVTDAAEAVRLFENLTLPDFTMEDAVDFGALVETDMDGESEWFLLVPAAGGMVVEHHGMEITLLTPESGLYGKLVGMKTGDFLDSPARMVSEVM